MGGTTPLRCPPFDPGPQIGLGQRAGGSGPSERAQEGGRGIHVSVGLGRVQGGGVGAG